MGYNRENYRRIRDEYVNKAALARSRADDRKKELHLRFPELREIDAALAQTGVRLMRAAAEGKEGLEKHMAALRRDVEALRMARSEFLKMHGYPENYTDIRYECAQCGDTGFTEKGMCACMKRALVLAGYESSGIATLMQKQSFDNFRLEYYAGDKDVYDNMKHVLSVVRRYAENFTTGRAENMLFLGATGLGKTHLSTSLAKIIIDRGYDVVYESAQNIFSDFEHDRFKSGYSEDGTGGRAQKYLECELLIMDDLGTEVSNQFTISCLYNIINTRINRELSTIINTNLTQKELRTRYADRITSRLLGEFRLLCFRGEDIRAQKLRTAPGNGSK